MKVLIIGFTKVKYMPYLNFYYENMDKSNNTIDLLYWNRDAEEENLKNYRFNKVFSYNHSMSDEIAKIKKISCFIGFRKKALGILKNESYDFIIVLHSIPGLIILDYITKYFPGKYILDYRDSTYETFSPFCKAVNKLCQYSKYTFVSSDGFRKYFCDEYQHKIFTSHNLLIDSLKHRDEKRKNGNFSPTIRISFWGFIRHYEINLQLIDRVGTDSRFELHYYGREQDTALRLKNYAKNKAYHNIYFHGEYKPEDRYQFVRSTDIISNIYNNDNNMNLCMGNKYYDGIVFCIPQLFIPDSYMGKRGIGARIGLECDPSNSDFCDIVYDYYYKIDYDDFRLCCDNELNKVLKEYYRGAELIRGIGGKE